MASANHTLFRGSSCYSSRGNLITWWSHQMKTFSALLALYAGNSPVTGEFPAQRPVTRSFGAFFDLRLNKRLSNNRDAGDLRRNRAHCDITVMEHSDSSPNNGHQIDQPYSLDTYSNILDNFGKCTQTIVLLLFIACKSIQNWKLPWAPNIQHVGSWSTSPAYRCLSKITRRKKCNHWNIYYSDITWPSDCLKSQQRDYLIAPQRTSNAKNVVFMPWRHKKDFKCYRCK